MRNKKKTEEILAISPYTDVEKRLRRSRRILFKKATEAYEQLKREKEEKEARGE